MLRQRLRRAYRSRRRARKSVPPPGTGLCAKPPSTSALESSILMDMTEVAPRSEIDKPPATGDHDLVFLNCPGEHALDRIERGSRILAGAFTAEVRGQAVKVTFRRPESVREAGIVTFTRRKAEAMMGGLFPGKEQGSVRAPLERSLIFPTPEAIDPLTQNAYLLSTA